MVPLKVHCRKPNAKPFRFPLSFLILVALLRSAGFHTSLSSTRQVMGDKFLFICSSECGLVTRGGGTLAPLSSRAPPLGPNDSVRDRCPSRTGDGETWVAGPWEAT